MLKQNVLKRVLFILFFLSFVFNVNAQLDSVKTQVKQTKIYKFNLFSPLFGHSMFSFEKQKKTNRSIEFSLSLIGLGLNQNFEDQISGNNYFFNEKIYGKQQIGAAFGFGYRFYVPTRRGINMAYSTSLLSGLYFKPSLYASYLRETATIDDNYKLDNENIFSIALLMETGWQRPVSRRGVLDTYVGVGYGLVNIDNNTFDLVETNILSRTISSNQFAFTRFGRTFGLVLSGGIKVGIHNKPIKRKRIKK